MLSYDAPMPANQGSKDTPATATVTATAIMPTTEKQPVKPSKRRTYEHQHIWLVTGPAGCGKSTVGAHVSQVLNMPYLEGDSFHPEANIAKMTAGTPLTDADRWDWLTRLRDEAMKHVAGGSEGVVLACSALKRKYRDVIRVAAYHNPMIKVHFLYLDASEEIILQRVAARKDHYMGANMVHSQFSILERPQVDEEDIMSVDVSRTMEDVVQESSRRVLECMDKDLYNRRG